MAALTAVEVTVLVSLVVCDVVAVLVIELDPLFDCVVVTLVVIVVVSELVTVDVIVLVPDALTVTDAVLDSVLLPVDD